MRRWKSVLPQVLTVVVIVATFGQTSVRQAAAAPVRFAYEITVAGEGNASWSSVPANSLYTQDSGEANARFTVVYDVLFIVNAAARAVDAESFDTASAPGTITAKGLTGTATYTQTTSCVAGSACTGPPKTCAFTNEQISPGYLTSANMRLQDEWGLGLYHGAFTSGTVPFLQIEGGGAGPAAPIKCTGPAGAGGIEPGAGTVPGLTVPDCGSAYDIAIPLADIGPQHSVLNMSKSLASSTYCALAGDQNATEQVSYTITLDALPAPLHIGTSRISANPLIQQSADQLKAEIAQKSNAWNRLFGSLPDLNYKLDKANGAWKVAAENVEDLDKDIASATQQRLAAEEESPPGVRHTAQERDKLGLEVMQLQTQLSEAKYQSDKDQILPELSNAQGQLSKLNTELNATTDGRALSNTLESWDVRILSAKAEVPVLRTALDTAAAAAESLTQQCASANQTLAALGSQLQALGARLATLTFVVSRVTVKADGKAVYAANLPTGPFVEAQQLRVVVATLSPIVANARAQVDKAEARLVMAQSLTANALSNLVDTIYADGWKRTGIKVAEIVRDILTAAAEGGVPGVILAVAETAAVEFVRYITGSAAPAFRSQFDAEMTSAVQGLFNPPDPVSGQQVFIESLEEKVKGSVTEIGTDWAKKQLIGPDGAVTKWLAGGPTEPAIPSDSGLVRAAQALVATWNSNDLDLQTIQERLGEIAEAAEHPDRISGALGWLNDLGNKFAFGLFNQGVQEMINDSERTAWKDYFIAQSAEAADLAGLESAVAVWEPAAKLLGTSRALLNAVTDDYNPSPAGTASLVSHFLQGSNIQIKLFIVVPDQPRDPLNPLHVGPAYLPAPTGITPILTGRTATPAGSTWNASASTWTYSYTLDSSGLTEAKEGLALVVREDCEPSVC
jgi:hypothetical protein